MGVVYEALDQHRKTRVALKSLPHADADLLYRLKREFRSLRDLVHPNLIGLGELFEEDGHWFFTMELLDGEDLRSHFHRITRPAIEPANEATLTSPAQADGGAVTRVDALGALPGVGIARSPAPQPLDFGQVRAIFAQIAEGLLVIHDAGKIHRDIKPSNIMVTRDGRAVILDFGLATEVWDVARSSEGKIVGTVLYMAPEQAAAAAVGPPADWYSLGVVLYEIIVGRCPFEGSVGLVLAAKQCSEPRHPKALNPDCPDDLAELCMQLLRSDPLQRPYGAEVLGRIAVDKDKALTIALNSSVISSQRRIFVGREHELHELGRAYDALDECVAVTAFIHGESGIGKSTLIHHFIGSIERKLDRTMVLSSQCREYEAVPFKAMDGIIDSLSRYVCGLSDVAAAELVPRNASLLPGVFPVLGRIHAIATAPAPIHAATDPFHQRKRVFTALREMFCRLTERYRVICFIDDMQWVDSDSLHLLRELLRPPDQPRMLLLMSVRTSDEFQDLPQLPGEIRQIPLQRLNPEESVVLAEMLLDRLAPEQKAQTSRIVDETGGHPLFIGELVRYAAGDSHAAARQLRLDEAIWARASQLSSDTLRVLKILSIAVAPMPEEIIRVALGLHVGEFHKSISALRVSNLIRSATPRQALLEVYHDRVRQSIIRHMEDRERIELNERLAVALERSGVQIQPELLIHHLEGAAQLDKAARKALEAAERAQAALAFEQAAHFYDTALRLGTWSEAERREIFARLGDTLASAGRGPEAAEAYTQASRGADPTMQLTCRIQVADQLVQSGHLESGATLLFSLFREHGHEVPESQVQLAARVAWYRIRLALHGLRWKDRPSHEIPPADHALLLLYKAVSRGLILVDPVRAAYFVIRGLWLAMKIGAPDFILYFLWLEAGFRASEGPQHHQAFLARVDALMRDHPDPAVQRAHQLSIGSRLYLSIDRGFVEAFEVLDRSDDELARTANAAWELSAGRFFLIYSLHKIGDFAKLRPYSERFIREAEQRGNLYTRTTISRLCNILWLVDDNPEGAREDLNVDSWISFDRGYHMQHWLEFNARIELSIYEDAPIDREFLSQHLARLRKSLLQRVLGYRCDTAWLVGRMALSEMKRDRSQKRVVHRSIAKLQSCATHYSRMLARMLRATLAVQEGDVEAAVRHFRDVVAMGETTGSLFITAAARGRLGALVGGDEGRDLTAAAGQWMQDAGIKNVDRMTNLVSPCNLDALVRSKRP